jgi:hypothetical protein
MNAVTTNNEKERKAMERALFIRGIAPLAACALLLPMTTSAQTTTFTATGWVNGVQFPGIICTNALGQVLYRGVVHTARVQATDARLTGQVLIIVDGAYNADGTVNMQGPGYLQVGTWDAAGTNFTPTGGLWEMPWHGVMQTNYSAQVSIAGCGSGGAIDGWRLEMTLTRAAAAGPIDPAVPYLYNGTIQPPPVNTREVVGDPNHPFTKPVYGSGTCFNSNGQFYAVGDFRVPVHRVDDCYVLGQQVTTGWSVPNGTTREWRVDLVSLSDNATNMADLVVSTASAAGYGFFTGRDFAYLLKWSSSGAYSILWCETNALPLPNKNVVLALALTYEQPNLVIRARVLDKADPNTVLFEHSVVDTPASEPSLTAAQFKALTGIDWSDLLTDAAEAPPITLLGTCLGVAQNTDGHQPVPTAVFANFELRTYEVPPVSIARAVQLTWPAPAGVYAVEGAPTVQGPWLRVQDQATPGFQTMSVPANSPAQFFRLIQAP